MLLQWPRFVAHDDDADNALTEVLAVMQYDAVIVLN